MICGELVPRAGSCAGTDTAPGGLIVTVSDGVALAYLADVYVLEEHRGHGLGEALVHEMIDHGPGNWFRWMLHTADAHELYRKAGFAAPDDTYMERPQRRAP